MVGLLKNCSWRSKGSMIVKSKDHNKENQGILLDLLAKLGFDIFLLLLINYGQSEVSE